MRGSLITFILTIFRSWIACVRNLRFQQNSLIQTRLKSKFFFIDEVNVDPQRLILWQVATNRTGEVV